MLNNQTLETLYKLKLTGMKQAYAAQLEQPTAAEISFDERFALVVGAEETERELRRQTRLLKEAKLRHAAASVEDIDYRASRGIERSRMSALVMLDWVKQRQNLHITGATGTGKSWLACALGNGACRRGMSVKYERVPNLLETLRLSRGDGSWGKRLLALGKAEMLILDDFGLKTLTNAEKHDLLEIVEERHGRGATIVTSQLPVKSWHEYLGEPTIADALLDRLLSNAHRLELSGESLRKSSTAVDATKKEEEK